MTRRLLPLLVMLGACRGDDRPPPPSSPRAAALAHGTQFDLARELVEADRHGTWSEVRRRWQGQRLRWTVLRYPQLCRTPTACNVAAFPIASQAGHGWMPTLELTTAEYARVEAACGTRVPCELTIEGTLRALDVSGDLPTTVTFSDVALVPARG